MDLGLKGKIALVTGASSGIGRVAILKFSEEGAKVVIHRHTNKNLVDDLIKEIKTDYLVVEGDVTNENDVKRFFKESIEKFGQIDIVVANAGVANSKDTPINEMELERFEKVLAVNLKGAWLTAREFFRNLKKSNQKSASLIFTASTSGIFGEEGWSEYAASKAALTGLVLTLKNEIIRIIPNGRVNAVAPGWTWTPMTEEFRKNKNAVIEALETHSLRRIANAEDVAKQIVILSSEEASGYITGQILRIDGGMEGRVIWQVSEINLENI
ncbi:SDR family oxidoreductase [Candidatus Giovannonibacteria bacterium]|nr:SDR family oxidoreductase [Candidatus Giovannonibacteria bacterium]